MTEEVKYSCAVCGGAMKVAGKCEHCALEEFNPKYFHAFVAMMGEMIHAATGRTELYISKDMLDKFNIEDAAKFKWDPQTDNWILVIAEETPVIVGVNKKILRSRN